MKLFFIPTLVCFMQAVQIQAQPDTLYHLDPIATDRPDQTESAEIVPKGFVQMEFGFAKIDAENESFFVYPNALIKYGVNENFELRFITSYAKLQEPPYEDIKGFFPLTFGFKAKLTEEKGIWPKISFLGHFVLPDIVHGRFEIDHLAPDLRFAFQHSISDFFSLGYNLGVFWDGDDPYPIFVYSLAPGFSFGKLGFYVEVYGFVSDYHAPGLRALADAGVTYLVNNDLQLDFSLSKNIGKKNEESYVALGVSYRFKI